ncbi:DUF2244 domain-containing protein [Hirschia litorea]|uniref:DUF2244 domain-containing protein n=1 Tax=Hirschia litorea TaxID=1199156 RepID=A0ABW2IMJ7_9PROT
MMQDTSKIYMDATLRPSRSLSNRGFIYLVILLACLSVATSLAFLPYGFFIVMGFLAIDLIILWGVFSANNKNLSQRTFVTITSDLLTVRHIDPKGVETSASLPTAFARASLAGDTNETNQYVKLTSSGQAYAIGRFLTPKERQSFLASISQALQAARNERYS